MYLTTSRSAETTDLPAEGFPWPGWPSAPPGGSSLQGDPYLLEQRAEAAVP